MGGKLAGFLFNILRRLIDRSSSYRRRPTAEGTEPFRHRSGVSMDYRNIIQLDAKFIGDDLRKGRLLSLAVRGCARQDRYFSIGLDLYFTVLKHSLRPHGADLNVGGYPDPQIFSLIPEPFLIAAQFFIAGQLER